jgi:hypothetical protein
VAHYLYQPMMSEPRALNDPAFFAARYRCSVFAYRPLMRESLLAFNQWAFGGAALYKARALLNTASLVLLNSGLALLARRFGVTAHAAIRVVLELDLVVLACLFVNSNPYTLPMAAFIYGIIYFAETDRPVFALGLVLIGMLCHELVAVGAIYFICRLAGSITAWPSADAVRRNRVWIGAAAAAVVVPYAAVRMVTMLPAGCEPLSPFFAHVRLSQLVHPAAWIGITFVAGVFVAYLDRRVIRWVMKSGRLYLVPFFASSVPLAVYFALFADLEEVRLFLPYFPLLIVVAALPPRRAAVPAEM